jgi:hypothetical protein
LLSEPGPPDNQDRAQLPDLARLAERHPGLSPALGAAYAEAASVCLDRHHTPPVPVHLDDAGQVGEAELRWSPSDLRTRHAWANDLDATRDGAYACVLAALELLRGHVAVRRAEHGSGADYYVGLPGSGVDGFEDCIRLEVSGTDRGSPHEVARRLGSKVRQAAVGSGALPAIAGVIGFEAARIAIADVDDPE